MPSDVILKIKRACEEQLNSITPSVQIAYEGVNFVPPESELYEACQFYLKNPDDPTFGLGYYRERFQFQVFVADIKGKGTSNALSRAELIRQHFGKGTTLVQDDIKVLVLETPKIAGTTETNDRIVVPVLIDAIAEVYS